MKNLKIIILITIAFFASTSFANTPNNELKNTLIFAKILGNCDYLDRLAQFESVTKGSVGLSDRLKNMKLQD
jgi:hypothetical protein